MFNGLTPVKSLFRQIHFGNNNDSITVRPSFLSCFALEMLKLYKIRKNQYRLVESSRLLRNRRRPSYSQYVHCLYFVIY